MYICHAHYVMLMKKLRISGTIFQIVCLDGILLGQGVFHLTLIIKGDTKDLGEWQIKIVHILWMNLGSNINLCYLNRYILFIFIVGSFVNSILFFTLFCIFNVMCCVS